MPSLAASFAAVTTDDEPELGAGSMWLLRIGSAVFLGVLLFFLIDAIAG